MKGFITQLEGENAEIDSMVNKFYELADEDHNDQISFRELVTLILKGIFWGDNCEYDKLTKFS